MNFPDRAKELYLSGYTCSESVLHAAKDAGLIDVPPEFLKIATGFLAGIGHSRSLCGALASAVMIVSLKYGRTDKEQSKDNADQKCAAVFKRFLQKYGNEHCSEIASASRTGVEFLDPKRREYCADVIKTVAGIVEEVFY
ncbi:MAG: C-GCAxxG-C-C family protein [Planctomycetota bacterium]